VLCFVKSSPWLVIGTYVSKKSISFYRNIVCKNVSCDVGLTNNFYIFAVKLGHFIINEFFPLVTNPQALQQKLENKEKRFIGMVTGAYHI